MAELENRLRKLRDRKCEVDISNRNLEIIVDTESSLRQQKDNAEAEAVRAVNSDLKEHITRLETGLRVRGKNSDEPRRLTGDLTAKYQSASQKFKDYLFEAEESRD